MIDWKAIYTYDPTCRTSLRYATDRFGGKGRKVVSAGKVAGTIYKGYGVVKYEHKMYRTHRIIWEMHYGEIPEGMQVDHIDGKRANNAISNLRLVTPAANSQNQTHRSTNASGVMGIAVRDSNGIPAARTVAHWMEDGKQRMRSFSHAAHGGREASLLVAINFRNEQLRRMNAAGASYTERHINGN